MLKHKGYIGHVIYDDQAEIFHGEVINLKDVITFQSDNAHELKQAFMASIEDYLAFCQQRSEAPEKPFSGKLNLRLTPELHQTVYVAAKLANKSLNNWMCDVLRHAASKVTG